MSATIRDGYKFELGRRLGVHVVVAVKCALVVVFRGAVGGALNVRGYGIIISRYLFPMFSFRKNRKNVMAKNSVVKRYHFRAHPLRHA